MAQDVKLIELIVDKRWERREIGCFTPSQPRRITSVGKRNLFLPTGTNSGSLLYTNSTVEDWRNLGKMKLNEPGRQKLGR